MKCSGCDKELTNEEILTIPLSILPDDINYTPKEIEQGNIIILSCNRCGCDEQID